MRWGSLSWPFLLGAYAALSVFAVAFMALDLSFQHWLVILYPLVGVAFCLAHAVERLGLRRALLFLGLTLAVSLLFETLGVATGWIYGPYHYSSDHLGLLFLGLVPYLIPLTWFMMLYPSYVIADRCTPWHRGGKRRWLAVAALGGLAMAAWDLALDPLMVRRGNWVWERPGGYYGVPWLNYLGWWLTAFVILALYQRLGGEQAQQKAAGRASFDRLAVLVYLITGLASAGEAWSQGLSGPAFISGCAVLVWFLLGWREQQAAARP
jgi:putative membrane protein